MCCIQWWESVDVMSSMFVRWAPWPRGVWIPGPKVRPLPCNQTDDERLWTDRISRKTVISSECFKETRWTIGGRVRVYGGPTEQNNMTVFYLDSTTVLVILGYFSPECFKEHILKGEVMWYFYLQIFCCLFSTRIIQISEERRVILLILVSEIIC